MIKLGNSDIGKMYLGSTAIGKAYLGSNLVFQQGGGVQPVMVPYIRGGANGSYIDTGITPDNTTRVIVWARNWNPAGAFLFGSRTGTTENAFALISDTGSSTGKIVLYYGNARTIPSPPDCFAILSNYHKYELNGNILSVDDVQLVSSTGTFTSNALNLHLFGINNNGSHTSMQLPIDICACQIYKNDVLVRDFTAVNTPSVGLYDSVSQTLFTNAGSGSFTYGEFDKNAYTPLEYIECDGKQYYDSGIYGSYALPIVTKLMSTNTAVRWMGYMGVFSSSPASCCSFTFGNADARNAQLSFRLGAATMDALLFNGSASNNLTNKAIVITKNNNAASAYLDNTLLRTGTLHGVSTSFATTITMYVGATRKSADDTIDGLFRGRIYYNGFGAEASFVPAKIGSRVGMYDTYNDVFHRSITDTPFIAGPTL